MQEPQSWRVLLGTIIHDPQEKERLARALRIRPATLSYWVYGEARPRSRQLYDLLQALPAYHEQLTPLLADVLDAPMKNALDDTDQIPAEFRARFTANHTSLPGSTRIWGLCLLALQQMLVQLDPYQLGLVVKIVCCMPPSEGNKVRSLREFMGDGTPPWHYNLEHDALFLGANSLAGCAITAGHTIVAESLAIPSPIYEASAVACPIMHAHGITGCIFVASIYEAYFTPVRLSLLQQYAELLTAVFESQEFYDAATIDLWEMPAPEAQHAHLFTLRRYIFEIMLERNLPIMEAEQLAWQRIEHELLQILQYLPPTHIENLI